MLDQNTLNLIKQGDNLFTDRATLDAYFQDAAENFCPDLAEFTSTRWIGADFAGNLMNSTPLIVSRDLTNTLASLLRPETQWMFITTAREDKLDNDGRAWCEWATGLQYRAMYDPTAQLKRAASETDRFYINFGQGVISKELDRKTNTLLFRSWHLRDVVWCEDYRGKIDTIHRKWKADCTILANMFPGKLHPKLVERMVKEPYCKVNVRHIIMPAGQYKSDTKYPGKGRTPFVSVYIDVDNQHEMEVVGKWSKMYTIPRWLSIPGSQYAHSPAVMTGIADARLLQRITLTLLEAGEMAVDPPRIYPAGMLPQGMQLFAGGLTAYDNEYDEKTGEILRSVAGDPRGLQHGMVFKQDTEAKMKMAFFLDKIGLAPVDPRMTAFQVAQVVQENIRNVMPLLGATEPEYNGDLCEDVFTELKMGGAFGNPEDVPESIRGNDVKFKFESPLHRQIERENGQKLLEAKQLLASVVDVYPQGAKMLKWEPALRDALTGVGTPAKWISSEDEMEAVEQKAAEEQQTAALLQSMNAGAMTAKNIGDAGASFQQNAPQAVP